MQKLPKSKKADIGLLLEGSYPFVLGGVSQWIHQIINNFSGYTFAIIFLGSAPENYSKGICYQLPKNVVHLQIHYLFQGESTYSAHISNQPNTNFDKVTALHESFRDGKFSQEVCPIKHSIDTIKSIDQKQFLFSKQSWDYIVEQFNQYCSDPSFIDYFWTVKNIHQPLWQLTQIGNDLPELKILHTLSTGYAGLLGAILNNQYDYPLILSEHGIYTKERKIDILQSEIVRDYSLVAQSVNDIDYLRNLWNNYFETLGKLCYQSANPIISLFKTANQLQIEGGAASEKTAIIPNGVDIQRFKKLRRPFNDKKIIGFIGRVVPIKDVKGFIRAIALTRNRLPDIQTWIIGSQDENPEYANECLELIENLSLTDAIEFKLHQSLDDVLPLVRVVILNSISEGMPLVVLESFAAGIPVLSTDVGSCQELIEGKDEADRAIGHAGKIVNVADPQAMFNAILEFFTNHKLWEQASESAIRRVEKYYDQTIMFDHYKKIYTNAIKNITKQDTGISCNFHD